MRYLFVLLMLSGCASQLLWEKPGASAQDFEMDRGQCQAQAFGAPGMYTMQIAMIYNACMRGKGWYQVSDSQPPARSSAARENYRVCNDEAERISGTRNAFDAAYKAAYEACMQGTTPSTYTVVK